MILPLIVTNVYKVSRFELAFLATREYLRLFWWFVMITPLFGLIALIFTRGALQVVGMMALLWPLTIPGRSMLSTTKSGRLFSNGCHLEFDGSEAVFLGEATHPKRLRFRLPVADIRAVLDRGDYLLLRTRRFGFAPVRKDAFQTEDDQKQFVSALTQSIQERFSDSAADS